MSQAKAGGQEQNSIKLRRRETMIKSAVRCFCEKGIERTALSDIAAYAQVGEATLYRYFSTKENLVMDCGIDFWQSACTYYKRTAEDKQYQNKNGLLQVEALLCCTEKLFWEKKEKFKFLHDLDAFLVSHRIEAEKLQEYEALIAYPRPILCDAIEKGKRDGSIACTAPTEELYYTLTHTILSLLEKLAGIGAILSSDNAVTEEKRMILLRKLLLEGLKNGAV